MQIDRLKGVRLKIDHAKKRLAELENAMEAFIKTTPCRISVRCDIGSRKVIYFVASVDRVPDEFSLLTGDVINNLRSALEHLAGQLVTVGTQGTVDTKHVYFPIAENRESYLKVRPKYTKGMDQPALDIIDGLEPYGDGQGADYYTLHKLNNLDKHSLLIAVGAMHTGVNIGAHFRAIMRKFWGARVDALPPIDFYAQPAGEVKPIQAGDELFTDAPDADVVPDFGFQFGLTLQVPAPIKSEAPSTLLHRLVALTESTVTKLEKCLT